MPRCHALSALLIAILVVASVVASFHSANFTYLRQLSASRKLLTSLRHELSPNALSFGYATAIPITWSSSFAPCRRSCNPCKITLLAISEWSRHDNHIPGSFVLGSSSIGVTRVYRSVRVIPWTWVEVLLHLLNAPGVLSYRHQSLETN